MEAMNRISFEMSEEELSQKVRAIVEMTIESYNRNEPVQAKEEFLSKKELGELIGKSETQIWRYEQEGIFTSRRVGGRCEYERSQAERFLYLRNVCRIVSTDKLKEAVRMMVQREMDLVAERLDGDVVDLASAAGVVGVEVMGAIRQDVYSYVKAMALREAKEQFDAKKEAKRVRDRNARELERAARVDAGVQMGRRGRPRKCELNSTAGFYKDK